MNHVKHFISCAILSLLCLGCIAGQADAAPKKKLDLRLKSTSKSESDLLTFNKNQVDDPSTNLGSFFLEDRFEDALSEQELDFYFTYEDDDPKREQMARRYFARYASKRLGGLLKDSALRPIYKKSQEVVEKSRNAITYDPAKSDPKEVWFEADISFGLDAGRRFQPVLRVGEHFRFYTDLIDGKALLETEWSY